MPETIAASPRPGRSWKPWHHNRSLARRVSLLTTIAVGLAVAFLAAAAWFTVRHQLMATLDQSLENRASAAAQSNALDQLIANEVPAWMVGAADVKVGFITASGEIRTVEQGPPEQAVKLGDPELAVARGEQESSVRSIATGAGDYRVAAVPAQEPGTALVLAQSLRSNEYTLEKLGVVLLIIGGLGVGAAALAGWGVARNSLRPVRRLTSAAEDIARTEKLEPIEVEGDDEIARLASAFNAMLTALAASRDRQRRLVADAGHELRTPLTSLRTNIDLLRQADRQGGLDPSAREELMNDVRFQIDELTNLIGDLTELAREDAAPVAVQTLDLAEVLDHALERVRRRAPHLHFAAEVAPWWVTGEPSALERAITNLLDNAAKWSPPDGVVTVRLTAGTLLVSDEGHGIDDADLPHVFDRFYRSPESRTMPGSGLGLAIVRQVADRHGGAVRAGNAPSGGASFRLTLPGSSRPAPEEPGSARDAAPPVRPSRGELATTPSTTASSTG